MPIYNDKGQIIGGINGNCLFKKIQGSKHFLQVPPAIAWDIEAVREGQDLGTTFTRVTDTETDIVYTTTIATLWKHGIHINRGHSPQIALPFKWWTELNPAQTQMFEEV